MNYGRNVKRVKINSGGMFLIGSPVFGAGSLFWRNPGIIQKGTLLDKDTRVKIPVWDGLPFELRDERSVNVSVILNQAGENELKLSDILEDQPIQLLFSTGKVESTKENIIYVPEVINFRELSLEIPGKPQVIQLDFSAVAQASNVKCLYDAVQRNGYNKFYAQFDYTGQPEAPDSDDIQV
jgi:hypothetical protein